MINKYLFGHTSAETAYLANDYPYGFRLRTQIRYWIETTKNGDRFVSQTLNPKTGKWNKEKKSTYNAVDVMGLDELNHITYTCFSLGWDDEEKINAFLQKIGGIDKLSSEQKKQVRTGIAISRTQKHISYEIVNTTFMSKEERDKRDAEQKEASEQIKKSFVYEYRHTEI